MNERGNLWPAVEPDLSAVLDHHSECRIHHCISAVEPHDPAPEFALPKKTWFKDVSFKSGLRFEFGDKLTRFPHPRIEASSIRKCKKARPLDLASLCWRKYQTE